MTLASFFFFNRDHWNKLDFLLVVMSLFELAVAFLNTSFVRVLRVLRVQRLLRLVRVLRVVRIFRNSKVGVMFYGNGPCMWNCVSRQCPRDPQPPHFQCAPSCVCLTLFAMCVSKVCVCVRVMQGVKSLFTTLVVSLPGFGNVGALIALFFFMYAYVGVLLFVNVRHQVRVRVCVHVRGMCVVCMCMCITHMPSTR